MIVYGLIGFPLTHSFSEKYFTEKFKKEGLKNRQYRLFPLPNLTDFLTVLKTPELAGLNVTIPYKQTVIPYLDELDFKVKEAGAVNTIRIAREADGKLRLTGYNTDIKGFLASADFSRHRKALVLGTGGASAAVCIALESIGIGTLLVSRQPRSFRHVLYQDIDRDIIREHTLIVNATPLGMYPDIAAYPALPYEHLTKNHFLYDLIYNPGMTVFMEKGKEREARIMNGLRMLYLQADLAWEIWNR